MTHWIDRLTNHEDPYEKLMQEVSQSAAEPIDLDQYCEMVLGQIAQIFQPHGAGLFLKQKAAGRFHLSARLGLAIEDLQLDLNHPLPAYFNRQAKILHGSDLDILPQFRALWEEERQALQQLNAELFIPLKAGGDLVGILAMGARRTGKRYQRAQEKQLIQLCNQAALVIRIKYLSTAEERWRQEAESMQRALSEITTDCDLQEGLNRNLLHIRDAFAYDTAAISLLQGDRLVVAAAHGYSHADELLGQDVPAHENLPFQDILRDHQTILVEDTRLDDRFKHYAGPSVSRIWMGVPLITQGEVTGLLSLSSRKAGAFQVNPARLELVQAFANQAAIIVEKARLFQMERQQRHLADALQNIGSEVENIADFDQVLDFLLERVGKAVPADITMLFLVEGGRLDLARTNVSAALHPDTAALALEPTFEAAAFANLHYLVNDKRPQVIIDTEKDQDWVLGPVAVRSWAGAPVIAEGKVMACFTFSSLKPGNYQPQLIELLAIFAEQAALALQNFRLYKEVRQLSINDELTGLFNRRHFLDLGEREFRRARRFNRQLSVMLVDVDQFKKVYENYGEDASSQVLRGVADLIKANVRNVDVPAHYPTERFAVILTETDRPGAEVISERLRVLIAESPNITTAGLVKITVSIGVAVMAADTPNLTTLMNFASQALEEAKKAGRNRIVVHPLTSRAL